MTQLNIKNMVCNRCKMAVDDVLQDLGYHVESVTLGRAQIDADPGEKERQTIDQALRRKGFELIGDEKHVLIEQVKSQLIAFLGLIENADDSPKLSEYLAENLHHNYSYLSSEFSKHQGLTIEQYFIDLKIERVKELLTYDEQTLSEIAWKLNYSSVQYLSNQFKKVTGETVSSFRKHMDEESRRSLDAVQSN